MPWNLKVGQCLLLETMPRSAQYPDGAPRSCPIQSIHKERGTFTGATVWRVRVESISSPLGYEIVNYHGKMRGLFPTRAIVIA